MLFANAPVKPNMAAEENRLDKYRLASKAHIHGRRQLICLS